MQGPFLRKYGVEAVLDFTLYALDGTALQPGAVHASGDSKIMKNEAAEANTANGFVDEGQTCSITLSAAEMTTARAMIILVDQTSPQAWLDTTLYIETYGHASAQHPYDFGDLDDIQSRLPAALVGGRMSSDAVSISGSTDAADKLEASAEVIIAASVNDASATTTSFITTLTETDDNFHNGSILIFTSGALITQRAEVTGYNGSTFALTVSELTSAPADAVTFILV